MSECDRACPREQELLDKLRGHELMSWPKEAHRLQQQRNAALVVIGQVRRYAVLTLDSCSIERRGMAEDILDLLGDGE